MPQINRMKGRRVGFSVAPHCEWRFEKRCATDELELLAVEGKSIADAKVMLGIFAMEQKFEELEERLSHQSRIVPLQSLAPYQIDVLRPIMVVIQEDDGCTIASWIDANVNASGDAEAEAIGMLKDAIASSFDVLRSQEDLLGDDLRIRLSVMRQFLRSA